MPETCSLISAIIAGDPLSCSITLDNGLTLYHALTKQLGLMKYGTLIGIECLEEALKRDSVG
jgi:hypothetical protein